ncbi:hypothetical protein G3N95_12135 [Paraburkholderia sp. Tr-20389]|uniref:hypothetical protein n=1 Tax=Paraburkholderia sp. Tr-20389 TaxID=2703903 RepID=UPI001982277E|nr:hypothetical protein [Paraburkholderia sp. Tr-20389]MBN3753691.1 hypothetical protein [Paraburkholderia sp. Tr-20389]
MSELNTEIEIARLVGRAKLRKEEAKDSRDEGDIESAIEFLQDAIAVMDDSPLSAQLHDNGAASAAVKTLAYHLADCLGMLGGNYRRLDRFDEAQACFERGRIYEDSPRLEVASSYNLVNAITLPLERRSSRLDEQTEELRRAVGAISRQIQGERRNDRWAWADLAECQLLLGLGDEAWRSYRRARDLGDEDTVNSIVSVLQRLEAVLHNGEQEAAKNINEAIQALRG